MRTLNMKIIRLLAIALLLAPLGAQAQEGEGFNEVGKIRDLSRKHINLDDFRMRLSPTVKVIWPGNKQRALEDLRVGYVVGVKMIKYQGKSYVDYIYYLPGGDRRAEGEGQ